MASKNEHRTRKERFGNNPPGTTFKGCFIDDEYRNTEAFARLNGTALLLLMGFLARRRYNEKHKRNKRVQKYTNTKDIIYTLECMIYETHAHKTTVLEARQMLLDLGFVDLLDQVDWGNHANNRWGISDRFLKWHPDPNIRAKNGFKEHRPLRKKSKPKQNKQPTRPLLAVAN